MFNAQIIDHKNFFAAGNTLNVKWRIEKLLAFKKTIKKYQKELLAALKNDLNKPALEAYVSEIGYIYDEINFFVKNLQAWSQPTKVPTPFFYSGAKSFIQPEPYGTVLIISPWNYPVLLSFLPLIGAIAAGNCVVLKPSEYSAASSQILEKVVRETFEPGRVSVVQGATAETQDLLKEKFDFIFFTGSSSTGRIIAQIAAQSLTPTALELGGKNPCVIHKDAEIDLAAKKIVWSKFINCGQTCVAPDYLLIHNAIKGQFIEALKKHIRQFFGDDPEQSPDYGRIINQKHFERLINIINSGRIIFGGKINPQTRYIAPTIMDELFSFDSTAMREEIFGPIIIYTTYDDIKRAVSIVNAKPKPLSAYLFSATKDIQNYFITRTSSGGVCVNDVMLQSSTQFLPFGGVGESGLGRYHGKASFECFCNKKSILVSPPKADVKLRYPPYKKFTYFLLRLIMH
jgi:aldehyde dehydrogenase (NAD+)